MPTLKRLAAESEYTLWATLSSLGISTGPSTQTTTGIGVVLGSSGLRTPGLSAVVTSPETVPAWAAAAESITIAAAKKADDTDKALRDRRIDRYIRTDFVESAQ
jgi:hypothetical protein